MTATSPVRLLVDGAHASAGGDLGSPWFALAPRLAGGGAVQVTWLDRGQAPQAPGVRLLPFPSHRRGACAADSLLIQQMCDHLGIDVFASTGWTTPAGTACLCLADAAIPEAPLASAHMLAPAVQNERTLALLFAQRIVCASDTARAGLLAAQPGIEARRVVLAGLNWKATPEATWAPALAAQLQGLLRELHAEARSGAWSWHFAEWRRLRRLQAEVDV